MLGKSESLLHQNVLNMIWLFLLFVNMTGKLRCNTRFCCADYVYLKSISFFFLNIYLTLKLPNFFIFITQRSQIIVFSVAVVVSGL